MELYCIIINDNVVEEVYADSFEEAENACDKYDYPCVIREYDSLTEEEIDELDWSYVQPSFIDKVMEHAHELGYFYISGDGKVGLDYYTRVSPEKIWFNNFTEMAAYLDEIDC